jgi:hypothetical protein
MNRAQRIALALHFRRHPFNVAARTPLSSLLKKTGQFVDWRPLLEQLRRTDLALEATE